MASCKVRGVFMSQMYAFSSRVSSIYLPCQLDNSTRPQGGGGIEKTLRKRTQSDSESTNLVEFILKRNSQGRPIDRGTLFRCGPAAFCYSSPLPWRLPLLTKQCLPARPCLHL